MSFVFGLACSLKKVDFEPLLSLSGTKLSACLKAICFGVGIKDDKGRFWATFASVGDEASGRN